MAFKANKQDKWRDVPVPSAAEAELVALLKTIAMKNNFSDEDYTEALDIALQNQLSAMICFTELVKGKPVKLHKERANGIR
jgi:hypothetical protein